MSDFTNNMFSNRDEYCYAIELALDTAAMETEDVTTEINNQSKEDTMKHYNNPCNEFNNTIFPVENGDDGRHCHVCGFKETEHIAIKGDAIIISASDDPNQEIVIETTNPKGDIVFNINKCNIRVNNHQCKRNRTSGCTMEINGELIYTCRQHYTQYSTALVVNIPVYHFTNIKPVQEDNDMNDEYNYDYEYSFTKQMELIKGEYEIIERKGVYFPTVIHELCDHDECARIFDEYMKVEICECCELTPCPHYTAMPCLFHPQTWYEFGGYTHYGSESMDCILACQLLGQHFFDTGQLNLSDLKTVTAPSPTCPSCKLLQIDGVNVTPEEMREAARQIENEINKQKLMAAIRVMDKNAQQSIDHINKKENPVNKPKITIAKTRTSDGTDNLWHIITTLDAAMLCRLDTEDWDSIQIIQSQEIDENLLHRVVGICPKCISQTDDHQRPGGVDLDDPKIPNTNKKEETKMDTTIVTINYKDKGYIRCPKCSKELLNSDPENDWTRGAFHRSVDEVRLCQTGTTVKPALTNGFVKASIWKGDNGDTMETMRFATRKEAVVYQIAVKGNQPKYDEKRGCWTVTYKLS